MDLMAYLVNVPYWALEVEAEYYIITSSKILSDLPIIHPKTLESTLSVLNKEGFIHTKLVKSPLWNCKHKVRSIKLTEKGKEYNNTLTLPNTDKEVTRLKKALNISESKNKVLNEKNQALELLLANMELPKEEKTITIKETKPNYTPDKDLVTFIEDTSQAFRKTGEAICNFVPTWRKEVEFNINSYGKLSAKVDNNNEKQVKNGSVINYFWTWLFVNQHRIGHTVNFKKRPDFQELKRRYIGVKLTIGKEVVVLSDLIWTDKGIVIEVKNKVKKVKIIHPHTKKINHYTIEECERLMLELC
jgi:DNA-binding PadR family transcriptional regulator